MISRVRSATTPTAPPPIGSTIDLAGFFAPAVGRKAQQRTQRDQRQQAVAQRHHAEHGGFRPRHFRNVVRKLDDLLHAVERQRIFLPAEFEADQRNLVLHGCGGWRGAGDCNRGRARCALAGNAKLAELVAQYPGGVENLDGAFAFGALDDAVQNIRVDRSGAGVVFLEPARRKRNQSVNAIDDVAHRRAARDDDDTRGFVQRCAGKAQQPTQIDHRQNHAVQIGESNKALWRKRHAGQVRHPDDFADVAELKSELAACEIEDQRNSPHDP